MYGIEKVVPPCTSCGSQRIFELQLVPSLLHVLEVDKHKKSLGDDVDSADEMDWGNIAVYTCPNASCSCDKEEFCVIQASVDEIPLAAGQPRRDVLLGDVMIREDAKFADDDSGEEDDDDDSEESVDEECW